MLLAVALVLVEARFGDRWDAFFLFAPLALAAAVVLYLGLQPPPRREGPPAFQSTLLVAGLALALPALLRLADLLGAEETGSAGTLTWVLVAFGALALWPALRHRSPICAFIGVLALGGALLAAWQWLFAPESPTPFRWLLALLAAAYVLGALRLRGALDRHAELLVSAAGLAVLGIALMEVAGLLVPIGVADPLPPLWEAVLVAAGCGLLAYAAVDRAPGPAYIGVAILAAFVALTSGGRATLLWWPLVLAALGLAAMAAGLRPRRPLPPEPDPYGAEDLPAAARSTSEPPRIRVRDDR